MSSKRNKKSASTEVVAYIIVISIIVVTLCAIYYVYTAQKLSVLSPEELQVSQNNSQARIIPPTPTPTPRAIPSGKHGFSISTSQNGPQFSRGFLDPYDPAIGTKQVITLQLTDTKPIQKAWITIQTDHKTSKPIYFQKTDGSEQSGEWQATWTVDDSYLYTYAMTFFAQSANGVSSVPALFR